MVMNYKSILDFNLLAAVVLLLLLLLLLLLFGRLAGYIYSLDTVATLFGVPVAPAALPVAVAVAVPIAVSMVRPGVPP